MAKEFKEWDKKFSNAELAAEVKLWLEGFEGSRLMDRVPAPEDIKRWSNTAIAQAVYYADDAADWQRFRVCMKGCTTYEKLFMLTSRRQYMLTEFAEGNLTQEKLQNEMIRYDNYIGALRRGGQLNAEFKVVK